MKNKNKIFSLLILALLFAVLSAVPLFQNDIFNAQDLTFHLSRIEGVWQCIQDRQFPFAIYPFKNYGYGYASPLFYCDLFLIIPAILHRVGFSLILSYKIFLFLVIFVGEFLFLYTADSILKNKKGVILSTVLWSFASYRITDIFIRGAVGEILALTFLPLLVLASYQIFVEKKYNYILLAVAFDAILFSHNITFFIAVLIFAILCLSYSKEILRNKSLLFCLLKATVLAILLASFYLFPMLEQLSYQELVMHQSLGKMLENGMEFSRLFNDFIFQQFKYNIDHPLSYSFAVGLLSVIFLPFVFSFKTKDCKDSFIKRLSIISMFCLIFATNLMAINKLSIFSFIQFPWRVFTIVITFSPLVAGYIFTKERKEIFILTSILCCLFLVMNTYIAYSQIMGSSDSIPNSETSENIFIEQKYKPFANIMYYNISELGGGEYLPSTHDFNYKEMGSCIAYPNYDAAICEYDRQGTQITFQSDLKWKETLLLPLSYYPGYVGYELDENGAVIRELDLFPEQYSKRVAFNSDTGIHYYKIEYNGTLIQKGSLIVSIFTSLSVLLHIAFHKRRNHRLS